MPSVTALDPHMPLPTLGSSSTKHGNKLRHLCELLQSVTTELKIQTQRATQLERTTQTLFNKLEDQIRENANLHRDYDLAKLQLRRAQSEIQRAQAAVNRLDGEIHVATAKEAKSKAALRSLKTEERIRAAREQGRKEGYMQGLHNQDPYFLDSKTSRIFEPESGSISSHSQKSQRSIQGDKPTVTPRVQQQPLESVARPPISRAASHASSTDAWIPQAGPDGKIAVPPAYDFTPRTPFPHPVEIPNPSEPEPDSAATSYSDFSILNNHGGPAEMHLLNTPLSTILEGNSPQPSINMQSLHGHLNSGSPPYANMQGVASHVPPHPSPSTSRSRSNSSSSASSSSLSDSSSGREPNRTRRGQSSEHIITIQPPSPTASLRTVKSGSRHSSRLDLPPIVTSPAYLSPHEFQDDDNSVVESDDVKTASSLHWDGQTAASGSPHSHRSAASRMVPGPLFGFLSPVLSAVGVPLPASVAGSSAGSEKSR